VGLALKRVSSRNTSTHPGETAQTRVLTSGDLTPPSLSTSTLDAPSEALDAEEVARLHTWAKMVIGLCVIGVALLLLVRGDPIATRLFVGTLAVVALCYSWLHWVTSRRDRYNPRTIHLASQITGLASHAAAYYFGLFSPYPAIVGIGIYVYSLGNNFRYAFLNYFTMAVGHAVLSGLIITGQLADRGLIHADYLRPREQIVLQLCVQSVFLIALLLGRMSRSRSSEILSRMERAVREVAHREALLSEARLELDRAKWFGGPGRYTDHVCGSFVLGPIIGRGAMGEVYAAEHIDSGRAAAVKLLQRSVQADTEQLSRFLREAEIASSLNVDNVVRVLETSTPDAPLPYLVMERLQGEDLAQCLRERGSLPVPNVVELVRQITTGLEAARRADIVHRDLKPHNLFLHKQGKRRVWKILDFGVSKLSSDGNTLTEGDVIGTPAYMAPEQARGHEVDHRADLYSLAIITYRSLTGHAAFSGKQVPEVLYSVVHRMPIRPSRLAKLPTDIDAVLAIAMAKDPADRFANGRELYNALANAASGKLDEQIRRRAARLVAKRPWGVEQSSF